MGKPKRSFFVNRTVGEIKKKCDLGLVKNTRNKSLVRKIISDIEFNKTVSDSEKERGIRIERDVAALYPEDFSGANDFKKHGDVLELPTYENPRHFANAGGLSVPQQIKKAIDSFGNFDFSRGFYEESLFAGLQYRPLLKDENGIQNPDSIPRFYRIVDTINRIYMIHYFKKHGEILYPERKKVKGWTVESDRRPFTPVVVIDNYSQIENLRFGAGIFRGSMTSREKDHNRYAISLINVPTASSLENLANSRKLRSTHYCMEKENSMIVYQQGLNVKNPIDVQIICDHDMAFYDIVAYYMRDVHGTEVAINQSPILTPSEWLLSIDDYLTNNCLKKTAQSGKHDLLTEADKEAVFWAVAFQNKFDFSFKPEKDIMDYKINRTFNPNLYK